VLPNLKILFLCTGNSCRSQMAEGWARKLHGDRLEPYSAGTRPGRVDPRAVSVMREAGVDLPGLVAAVSSEGEALGHYRRVRDEIRTFIEGLPQRLASSQRSDDESNLETQEVGEQR
jgi:hypothetical protein